VSVGDCKTDFQEQRPITSGRMLEAYTAFHNYSFGNALLALGQCLRRNLQPGPVNTYRGWLERKPPWPECGMQDAGPC
jgi:hypothetical protein